MTKPKRLTDETIAGGYGGNAGDSNQEPPALQSYRFEREFLAAVKRAMDAKGITARQMKEEALSFRGDELRAPSSADRAWHSFFSPHPTTEKTQRLTLQEAHAMTRVLGIEFGRFCSHVELSIELGESPD